MAGSGGIADAEVADAVRIVAFAATVVAVLLALRVRSGPSVGRRRRVPPDWMRRYNRVGIIQFVAIAFAVVLLRALGAPLLIPAAVCYIVGVHFFPLVRVFDQPQYRWTGVALCCVSVAGFVTFAVVGSATSLAVVGPGAALTLWSTAAHVALRG